MPRPAYRLYAATGIHKGDRPYQQDQVLLLTHRQHSGCVLGLVADGMGGRSGGRKASDQVVFTARQLFERFDPVTDQPEELLRTLMRDAHTVIRLTAISSEEEPHSTVAAFVLMPLGACHIAYSGDSRVYYYRNSHLMWRSTDHSYVQTLVDRGELSEAQAQFHPQSNILLGCLGTPEEPPVGTHCIQRFDPGDTIMAGSDGVWHYYSPNELAAIIDGLSPREASKFLIEKAHQRAQGLGDNLSLVILKSEAIQDGDDEPTTMRAPLR